MTFVIAVNYGSRDEITRAVKDHDGCGEWEDRAGGYDGRKFSRPPRHGRNPGPGSCDPHQRGASTSNYLLWQLAYSELYVTECLGRISIRKNY